MWDVVSLHTGEQCIGPIHDTCLGTSTVEVVVHWTAVAPWSFAYLCVIVCNVYAVSTAYIRLVWCLLSVILWTMLTLWPPLMLMMIMTGWASMSWYPAWQCIYTITPVTFSSVQFCIFSSSRRISWWKAGMKRWVLSRARNWLRLLDGERRWSGSEFQTTGAAMKKLRLPSIVGRWPLLVYHRVLRCSSQLSYV